jgi:hypothetical protein
MDNFNLKKFLTENKLTKTSVLREGLDTSMEEARSSEKKTTSKEALKTKIKEMIIAELDGAAVTDEDYDFVAEGEDYEEYGNETGEVGEKDYEDYQELKKFLNTLPATKNPNAYTDDIFNYNSEMGPDEDYYETEGNGEIDDYDNLGEGKFKLSEFFIDEAKKDEEEAPAEEAPEGEEVDATLDTTDTGEDFNIDTSAVNPNIKAVQDALTQAQAAAKSINDDKLTQQIGNTITMFTRTHIANTETISEGKSLTDGLTSEEKKIYDKVKNTITYKGMKKYDSKEYSKKLQKALQAAAMHNEESER